MLNPVHLRTLATVMSAGSFADAARTLGYTGSAVSQQMAALERQVHAVLFERDAHGVRPTPAAEYLAQRCVESLGSLQVLEDDVRHMLDGSVGRLRLGSFAAASRVLVPRMLPALARTAPRVEVELVEAETSELVGALLARTLDVALVRHLDLAAPTWPAELAPRTVLTESLLVLLPEGHPACDGALAPLRHEPWVSGRDAGQADRLLRGLCGAAGFEPDVRARSDDAATVRALVRAGLGLGLVGSLDHVPTDGVTAVALTAPLTRLDVVALRSPSATPALVQGVLDALTAAAADLAATSER